MQNVAIQEATVTGVQINPQGGNKVLGQQGPDSM